MQVKQCPSCLQPIFLDHQHYVYARSTGDYYCDGACLLVHVSRSSDDDRRWFEGELVPESQILIELEVVIYG